MIVILQGIFIVIGLFVDHGYAIYAPFIIPSLYIFIMAPGTFTGGSDINLDKLNEQLSQNWIDSEELAKYMKKYWVALQYSGSATARQGNCTMLAVISIVLGLYYYFSFNENILSLISGMLGIILYLMAMRVNHPLSIYKDPKFQSSMDERIRNEWRMSVTSLVAMSELFPENGNYQFISDSIKNDEYANEMLSYWRK